MELRKNMGRLDQKANLHGFRGQMISIMRKKDFITLVLQNVNSVCGVR